MVVTISGLASAVSYGFTPKPDCTGIHALIFLTGLIGAYTTFLRQKTKPPSTVDTQSTGAGQVSDTENPAKQTRRKETTIVKWQRVGKTALRYLNRFLKVVHVVICIMFIVGGVNLAKTYHYPNPFVTPELFAMAIW